MSILLAVTLFLVVVGASWLLLWQYRARLFDRETPEEARLRRLARLSDDWKLPLDVRKPR